MYYSRSRSGYVSRVLGGLLIASTVLVSVATGGRAQARQSNPQPSRMLERYGRLPLGFQPNVGQTAAPVRFLSQGSGYNVFLTSDEAVLSLRRHNKTVRRGGIEAVEPDTLRAEDRLVLRYSLDGARKNVSPVAVDRLPGVTNHLLGRSPDTWKTNVSRYGRVRYPQVYPGIDLDFYGNQRRLEYDFRVGPGSDPSQIALRITGASRFELAKDGGLLIHTANGHVRQERPVSFQVRAGKQIPVASKYLLGKDGAVRFALGKYDKQLPLVIDPVLCWSTFLGGSDIDQGNDIALDEFGCVYVTGSTLSPDFPFVDGSYQINPQGLTDAFIVKMNNDGDQYVYATFIGGTGHDTGQGIGLDPDRNVYITGSTSSRDFPIQGEFGADPVQPDYHGGESDAFILKLSANGAGIVYSTYYGGLGGKFGTEIGYDIAVDGAGNAYICGVTSSPTWRLKNNVLDTQLRGPTDGFVVRLDTIGRLDISTLLGAGAKPYMGDTDYGDGIDVCYGIDIDPQGNIYVTGCTGSKNFPAYTVTFQRVNRSVGNNTQDAFACKIIAGGKQFGYSTYLGGNASDCALDIDVDPAGNAYITGVTRSTNFPVKNALWGSNQGYDDAFVVKFNNVGSDLVFGTYLGGSKNDEGHGIAVALDGSVYVTGGTQSEDFPMARPLRGIFGGLYDCFVAKLSPDGRRLVYACYFGSNDQDFGNAIVVDNAGNAYVTGFTNAASFPTTEGVVQPTFGGGFRDGFVAKINDDDPGFRPGGKISIGTGKLDFGTCPLFTTITRFVQVRNVGKKPLTGYVGSLTGVFKVDSNGGPFVLEPKRKMNIRILFRPDRTGEFKDTLTITSSDANKPSVTIKILGRGSDRDQR